MDRRELLQMIQMMKTPLAPLLFCSPFFSYIFSIQIERLNYRFETG